MGISGSNRWRYVSTICLAIPCGDIPLHRPYIGLIYGRYLQFRFLKWPLRDVPRSPKEDGYPINRNHKHNNSDNKTVQVDDNP